MAWKFPVPFVFNVLSSPNQYQVSQTLMNPPPWAWMCLPVVSFQGPVLLMVAVMSGDPDGQLLPATPPSPALPPDPAAPPEPALPPPPCEPPLPTAPPIPLA